MRPFCSKQNKEQDAHLSRVKCGRIGRKVASTAHIAMTQNHIDVKLECQECHQMVKNLNKHNLRFHSSKYWGYKCNVCNHCESRLDNSFFKKHMLSKHGLVVEDVNIYKYDVVCGYKVPMKCPLCTFQCFEALDIKTHFSDTHPVVRQDRSNKVSSVGNVPFDASTSQSGSSTRSSSDSSMESCEMSTSDNSIVRQDRSNKVSSVGNVPFDTSTSQSGFSTRSSSDSSMESCETSTSDNSVELLEMSVYLLNLDENVSESEYDFDNELDLLGD